MKILGKKYEFVLLVSVMILSCIVSSCGDDDDREDSTEPVSVVGVWRDDFDGGYQILTLEKNGRYTFVEFDYDSGDWTEKGTYYVAGNIMTRIDSDRPEDPEVYTIMNLTSTKMDLRYEGAYVGQAGPDYSEKDNEHWTRIK